MASSSVLTFIAVSIVVVGSSSMNDLGQRKEPKLSADGKTINLNQLSQRDAMKEIKHFVKEKENEYFDNSFSRKDRLFYIIPGRELQSNVENFLRDNGYDFSFPSPGTVKVDLLSRREGRNEL